MTTQEAVGTIELYIIGTGGAKEPISGDAALTALRALEAEIERLRDLHAVAISGVRIRDAQIERMKSDVVLGAMVRSMPAGSMLCRDHRDDVPLWYMTGTICRHFTPEQAIRAEMGMAATR